MKNEFIRLNPEQKQIEEIVNEAFKSVIEKQFPKICNNCDELYISEEDYTKRTTREGNAGYCDRIGFSLYRNCQCGNTLFVGIEYNDLNPYQLSCIFEHALNLGEIAKKVSLDNLKKPESIKSNDFWKYMSKFSRFQEGTVTKEKVRAVSEEEWREIGLCILRDRYNMYIRGEEDRLYPQNFFKRWFKQASLLQNVQVQSLMQNFRAYWHNMLNYLRRDRHQ